MPAVSRRRRRSPRRASGARGPRPVRGAPSRRAVARDACVAIECGETSGTRGRWARRRAAERRSAVAGEGRDSASAKAGGWELVAGASAVVAAAASTAAAASNTAVGSASIQGAVATTTMRATIARRQTERTLTQRRHSKDGGRERLAHDHDGQEPHHAGHHRGCSRTVLCERRRCAVRATATWER